MSTGAGELRIAPGAPARLLAVAIPAATVALIATAASRGGLSATGDDPVPPSAVATLSILAALVASWRALTQQVVIDEVGMVCRNVLSSFRVEWNQVDALRVLRRPGLVMIEVRVHGHRRHQRMGAATRPDGDGADDVLAVLGRHRCAAAVLEDAAF